MTTPDGEELCDVVLRLVGGDGRRLASVVAVADEMECEALGGNVEVADIGVEGDDLVRLALGLRWENSVEALDLDGDIEGGGCCAFRMLHMLSDSGSLAIETI